MQPSIKMNFLLDLLCHDSPLIEDFRISGMLWYQGESNAERAYEYNQSFPID